MLSSDSKSITTGLGGLKSANNLSLSTLRFSSPSGSSKVRISVSSSEF